VDSISNSHASRTLPLPLRPGSQSGRRLAFVFILNYRLDCGSANSACRVRPTLAAHRPQTKTCPRKERRGSQTRGLHIPDLRGAATRTPSSPTRAHQKRWRLLDRLSISSSPITTSRIRGTPEEYCCLPGTHIPSAFASPQRHEPRHGQSLEATPRRSPSLSTPTCYIASTARP